MEIDLENLTIDKAHDAFLNKEYSIRDLVSAYLKNIKEKNEELNLYLEIFEDIEEQIKNAENMWQNGQAGKLTGIPIAIKDNILFKNHISSAGSKMLKNYKAPYDSTVISLLKSQGVIILGRANMDEFAMGSSNQTSFYGPARNPMNKDLVPGGSSGGSAGIVKANMALISLGTDTAGSVREPAAFCSLFGFKPTYGAISRYGIIAMGNSLDQVGIFAKNTQDLKIVFNHLNKYDNKDATSIPEEKRIIKNKNSNTKKIGIPWHLFKEGIDKEIMDNFKESIEILKDNGYEIIDINLPYAKYSLAIYYIIMPAEVSTNLSRLDGMRYGLREDGENISDIYKKSRLKGFGKETRRRIILGSYVLSHGYLDQYYNKALKLRNLLKKEFEDIFEKVDFVLTPTVPVLPFKIGEKLDDPVSMYLCDIFSVPANLVGIPSIAIPSGRNKDNLPFSIQFMSPHFSEESLFKISKSFEILKKVV